MQSPTIKGPGSHYKAVFEAILAELDAETRHRAGRTIDAWILAERKCVLHAINRQRALLAYDPIGIEDVERAERQAVGHSDYISKYAHAAADLVFRNASWGLHPSVTQVTLP